MTPDTSQKPRVAVIGAGVSGLIVAKRLKAEGLKVTVYERQSGPGGVWKFTENAGVMFASPVYGTLETNFPRELMEFSDSPWKDTVSLFPEQSAVEKYLRTYSKDVDVEYNTEVVELYRYTGLQPCDWRLTTRNVESGKTTTTSFEYVVMATGAFDRPFMPNYKYLGRWHKKYPDSISHSKTYRDANDFRGKRVVVVGNSASGWDISSQLVKTAKTVWVSSTRPNDRSHEKVRPATEIECLRPDKRLVKFDNNEKAKKVDKIIFCTGYLYSSDFLKRAMHSEKPLFPDGFFVDDLYEHIFWTERPTLAFVGIPKESPTFLISQAQSAVIARAFSRRIGQLPTLEDMTNWVKDNKTNNKRKRGDTGERTLHSLAYPGCKEYIDGLEQWCLKQDEEAKEKAPEGNKPFKWTDRIDWVMRNRREIREAFKEQRCDRKTFPTPESLGLSPVASQDGVGVN